MYDICIIGGGASGMMAAISAVKENPGLSICLVEKQEKLGRKLLATGNGKCNIANISCPNWSVASKIFEEIGVNTREDREGRVYPISESARDVVDAMVYILKNSKANIDIVTNHKVEKVVIKQENKCNPKPKSLEAINGTNNSLDSGCKGHSENIQQYFDIDNQIRANKLIIATGGKAAPQFGTTGDGYKWARELGHSITKLYPALAPMTVEDMESAVGVRGKGDIKLRCNGQLIKTEKGEIQFTGTGISGIAIFNLSQFIKIGKGVDFQDYVVEVDFLPEMTLVQVENLLSSREKNNVDILGTLVNKKLHKQVYKRCQEHARNKSVDIKTEKAVDNEEWEEDLAGNVKIVAYVLKNFEIKITGVEGWRRAQVTGGGVAVDEIYIDTMESRLIKNLFFVGEIIDYHGPCGGYNLQNAWETAIKAGKVAALV